jgi:hypothetical protein
MYSAGVELLEEKEDWIWIWIGNRGMPTTTNEYTIYTQTIIPQFSFRPHYTNRRTKKSSFEKISAHPLGIAG